MQKYIMNEKAHQSSDDHPPECKDEVYVESCWLNFLTFHSKHFEFHVESMTSAARLFWGCLYTRGTSSSPKGKNHISTDQENALANGRHQIVRWHDLETSPELASMMIVPCEPLHHPAGTTGFPCQVPFLEVVVWGRCLTFRCSEQSWQWPLIHLLR